jgi:hypothetical protein
MLIEAALPVKSGVRSLTGLFRPANPPQLNNPAGIAVIVRKVGRDVR